MSGNFIHCSYFICNLTVNYKSRSSKMFQDSKLNQSSYNTDAHPCTYICVCVCLNHYYQMNISPSEFFERDSPMTRPLSYRLIIPETFSLWTPWSFQMTEQSGKYKTAIIGQNLALSFL